MKILLRLLRLATPYWRWMVLSTLLSFLTIGSSIGLLMTSAYIIAKAALHPSIAELQVAIVGVRFFGIMRGIFRYLERLVAHESAFRLLTNLRRYFYEKLEPLAPARLQHYRSSDIFTRIIQDIQSLENFFIRVLAPPLSALLISALMWVLLGAFNPALPLAILGFQLLAGLGVPLLSYRLSRRHGGQVIRIRAELNALIQDGVQGMADLLALGQMESHQKRIEQANDQLERTQQKLARIRASHEALIGLLMMGAVISALNICIPLMGHARLDGVYLTVISLGVMASFEAYFATPDVLYFWESNKAAAQRVFEIIDARPEVHDPSLPARLPEAFDIQFRKLTFSYPSALYPALDDVSIDIPRRSKIAIVGHSGAGKSTLLHLLLRFREYSQGSILINGVELNQFDPSDVRARFALVSQRSHLFKASIRENLLLAADHADNRRLLGALEAAQLSSTIHGLKKGWDTQIGPHHLSGGESQRLVIAQAILKNAPTLILDEPTANLDVATERQIMKQLLTISEGKTLLLITHRLIYMDQMDKIYVLHEGRVAESGTHRELLSGAGLYKKMWSLQQEIYRLQEFQDITG
jgi:ATP-binding cassette subfamily C protein CydC